MSLVEHEEEYLHIRKNVLLHFFGVLISGWLSFSFLNLLITIPNGADYYVSTFSAIGLVLLGVVGVVGTVIYSVYFLWVIIET